MAQEKKKVAKEKRPPKIKTAKSSLQGKKIRLPRTKIKIVGLGGGGNSIVREIASKIKRADFVIANTDLQALRKFAKGCKIFHFGQRVTHNLGAGMDPFLGEKAAREDKPRIEKLFQGVDFTILVASLGGGTGSGSLPIFAQSAKQAGSLVLGIFTLPFKFEGEKKAIIAKESLEKAREHLNGLILISNEKIFSLLDKKTPLQEALSHINKILSECLGSLIEVFYSPGFINIDFSDLRTILRGKEKLAYLHTALAEGEERAEKVANLIFQNPLYETKPKKPKRILFNIAGSKDLKISEVEKIAKAIYEKNPQAKIIFGISQKGSYDKKLKVTLFSLSNQEKDELGAKKKSALKSKIPKRESQKKAKKKFSLKREKREKKKEPQLKSPKEVLEKEKEKEKEEKRSLLKKAMKKKKILLRRNALDLKKEAKKVEKEILAQEAKWDTPAFLRRKKGLRIPIINS